MNSKQYYECHITMMGKPEVVRPFVEEVGWKFSCIDGDPVLGDGIKCYATIQLNSRLGEVRIIKMVTNVSKELVTKNIKVLRDKVELVVYDNRKKE